MLNLAGAEIGASRAAGVDPPDLHVPSIGIESRGAGEDDEAVAAHEAVDHGTAVRVFSDDRPVAAVEPDGRRGPAPVAKGLGAADELPGARGLVGLADGDDARARGGDRFTEGRLGGLERRASGDAASARS